MHSAVARLSIASPALLTLLLWFGHSPAEPTTRAHSRHHQERAVPLAPATNVMPEPTRARDAGDPVDVFADLNGTWKGTFTGYDEVGKELYRIQVQQVYRRKDGHTQTVQVTDTMPDGTVIRGDGENTAHPSKVAGAPLVLKCVVRKSNGEIVRHDGRLGTGPDGHEQLVWFSKEDGKTETFREWVEKGSDGKPTVYHIQGMGRYGDTSILMAGRYEKQVESEQAEKDSRGK